MLLGNLWASPLDPAGWLASSKPPLAGRAAVGTLAALEEVVEEAAAAAAVVGKKLLRWLLCTARLAPTSFTSADRATQEASHWTPRLWRCSQLRERLQRVFRLILQLP